jgi:hypothetical protein
MLKVLSSQFPVLRKNTVRHCVSNDISRVLRTYALIPQQRTVLLLGWVIAALVGFGRAQQVDLAGGASTLWSPKPLTASQAFLPPGVAGGVYVSASLQFLTERRFGLNVEGALRPKAALYNGYQYFRPFLYDVNAVYAVRLAPKARSDLMAGVGGESLVFYEQTHCNYSGGCRVNVNDTHFLVHGGVGVRYYFWRTFFARPEIHYYFIPNNFQFHSDHVLRMGVSIGHTFGSQ